MRYLFDANAVIAIFKGHPRVLGRVRRRRPDDFGIPAIVAHELYFGAYKGSRTDQEIARVEGLAFPLVEFDREDARCSGLVRAALRAEGRPIGAFDTLIAAQALARSLILITHNTGEFGRVPGLKVEDWEG